MPHLAIDIQLNYFKIYEITRDCDRCKKVLIPYTDELMFVVSKRTLKLTSIITNPLKETTDSILYQPLCPSCRSELYCYDNSIISCKTCDEVIDVDNAIKHNIKTYAEIDAVNVLTTDD